MKKIYFLSTCSTNRRIIKELDLKESNIEMQEIKSQKITAQQLEEMKKRAGSYEALFSKRANNYKALNLQDKTLNEKDYKNLILADYTFLKRPVVIINTSIFIGSDKNNIAALKEALL